MAENKKTTAKVELAALAAEVEKGQSICTSVNVYLQNIAVRVLGSITALAQDPFGRDDYIRGIGAALKANKVACKYKTQLFDFFQYEGGVHKDEGGHWVVTTNKQVVEACKRAKTEAFTGYKSEKKEAEKAEKRAADAEADAKLSAEEYFLSILENEVDECAKKAKKAKDAAVKARWEARTAYIEAVLKNRKAVK